jgi:hypothetical protein
MTAQAASTKHPIHLAPSAADHLPISREVGVVEPPHEIKKGEAKPWAHFVAGASVRLLSTSLPRHVTDPTTVPEE